MHKRLIHELTILEDVESEGAANIHLVKDDLAREMDAETLNIQVGILDVRDYDELVHDGLKDKILPFLKMFGEIVLIDSHNRFKAGHYGQLARSLQAEGLKVRHRVLCGPSIMDLLGAAATKKRKKTVHFEETQFQIKYQYYYATYQAMPVEAAELAEEALSFYPCMGNFINDQALVFVGLPVLEVHRSLILSRWVIQNEIHRANSQHAHPGPILAERLNLFHQFLQTFYPGSQFSQLELWAGLNNIKKRISSTTSNVFVKKLETMGLFSHVTSRRVMADLIHEIEKVQFRV